MNTEELKIIMDALVSLGEAGKSGFIWWLVLSYGMKYLTILFFIVGLFITVRFVVGKILDSTHGNQLGFEMSKILLEGYDTEKWAYEHHRGEVKAKLLTKIRELQEKAANKAQGE